MRTASAAAAFLALLLPTAASAGEFIDTRISFLFTDEDVLHGAGETTPSSPTARIGGGRSSTLFFDNYETKFSGFETLTNLVLYRKDQSFFANLETEASLHLTLLPEERADRRDKIQIVDSSSYVRLNYRQPTWKATEGLSLTAFPISADRFRLGYSYRISWGGTPAFPGAQGGVPGAKLQFSRGPFYAFAGMKSSQILNGETSEYETNYGWLGGAGWDILEVLRFEAGGGIFQRGVLPKQGVTGEPAIAAGASAQLSYHVGMPIGTSVDFKLYQNDPEVYERFFKPENYGPGLSYSIAAEATYLTQTLQDADALESTVRQPAMAGDLQAKVRFEKLRVHATGSYRDLAFVLFNVPSLVPFQDFPSGAEIEPEFFGAAGADYFIESLHLTPGIVGGIQLPAAITTRFALGGNNPGELQQGVRTLVVRDEGRYSILPADEERAPIYSVKLTTRLDLSESVSTVGEVFYTLDDNRATIAQNEPGGDQPVRVFEDPDQLGFNLLLQARF